MKYFPFIRGKQYDLVALQEVARRGLISANIVPILEPVKDIAGLTKVTQTFAQAQLPLAVITNPQVGTYGLLAQPRYVMDLKGSVFAARYFEPENSAVLTIAQTATQAQLLQHQSGLTVVPNEARVRRLHLPHAIYLEDHFTTWGHTENYHLLQDEIYQFAPATLPGMGFSDYPLTSGQYFEQGYPQRAIALHLVYPAGKQLRLHHFVSVNNDDYQQPQAKFFEAASQLAPWLTQHPEANSAGLQELISLYQQQHFPAMGSLRKLQLMHHLEVIGRFLDAASPIES